MGGGLMQLFAMGAQDVYLTGNPQITFFKVVYRRHTNFSKECIAQQFNGNPTFGSSVTCTLARNGDLVQEIYLRAVLKCTVDTDNDYFRLEDVTSLIKTVEVEIGGQKIDKHYSQWLDIYNELFETSHDYRAVMNSGNGKIKKAVTAAASTATVSDPNNVGQDHQVVTAYVPLRFWFNRNPGLALPLIALQYHEVKISTENLSEMWDKKMDDSTSTEVNLSDLNLWCTYVYLDTDERRRFAQVSHEYLIEQIQYTTVPASQNVELNFNHPVKELIWMFNVNGPVDFDKTKNYNGWADTDTIGLQLNSQDRFAPRHPNYFSDWQVNQYHTGFGKILLDDNDYTYSGGSGSDPGESHDNPKGRGDKCYRGDVYVYSFALKPEEHQPSGTCNFSRIDSATLQLLFTIGSNNITKHCNSLTVFAKNYNILRIMSGMGGLAYSN